MSNSSGSCTWRQGFGVEGSLCETLFVCSFRYRIMWIQERVFLYLISGPWRCEAEISQLSLGLWGTTYISKGEWLRVSSPPWMRQTWPYSFLQVSLWVQCVFQNQRNNLRLALFVQPQAGAARLKVRTSMPLLLIRCQNFLMGNWKI